MEGGKDIRSDAPHNLTRYGEDQIDAVSSTNICAAVSNSRLSVLQGPGGLLSSKRAVDFIDGEGKHATLNCGEHKGQTVQQVAQEHADYLKYVLGKKNAQAAIEYCNKGF